MHQANQKKRLLIGGVIAGSLIILTARLLLGTGFEKQSDSSPSILKDALKKAQDQSRESFKEYAALKARIEAESQKNTQPDDATIKILGEKLKTTQPEPATKP